jgi:hypothetical protein
MISPKIILAEWVTALRALPNLVEAIGGDPTTVQFYSENTVVFGQATQANVRLAVLGMPPGSIMVVWQGTDRGRLGNALVFVHEFSLYLRAPETGTAGYEDLFNLIVNDTPAGGALKMLHLQVDPGCEPMDFYLPSARRNTIVISADGATFEYFEVAARLIESYNP